MDDAGPRSLFVVVSYGGMAPYFSSILQLETQVNNHENKWSPFSSPETQVIPTEFSAHFHQPQLLTQMPLPIMWEFSPLASSTEASFTEDLYMVPDWCFRKSYNTVPLHGCIFNLRTKKCKQIKPPGASKYHGHVVTLGGHIYFMAHPYWGNHAPNPIFERYNPLEDLWEELEPFPHHVIHRCNCHRGLIVATAVWDDTILLNIDGREIWAYNVGRNKWYPVNVKHDLCYSIEGEAVVLENTIYALTKLSVASVLALSIERKEIKGDLVFECSLLSEILVPGMEQIVVKDKNAERITRHLVHLGKDNFCLVRSCNLDGVYEYQHIQLTNIKLKEENSMTVTNICVHEFKISQNKQFKVGLCFSLPECKTTALKEGKRFFKFNPFPEGFASKLEDKTDFNPEPKVVKPSLKKKKVVKPVQEEEIVTLPKDRPLFNVQATPELQFQDNDSSQTNIIDEQDFEQGGSVIQSCQSRDHADTTPEVQEDVPKKSYASVVAAKINFASKASTISAVTGHPSHGYAKPSFEQKASTLDDCAASERSNTDEGHSIYVRNLPPDATLRQIEKGLTKFGPIQRGGIQVRINNMGKWSAFVEFESATSKQNAIKASSTIIEGCRAVIEEKRRMALMPLSRRSCFGKNK